MATRRPIGGPPNTIAEISVGDALLHGLDQNNSKEVDATNGLTAKTLTARRTYLTGTAGLTFTITLPAASAAIDGMLMTLMSTANRILVSWVSSGATVPGISGPNANSPITVQYNHASLMWYKVN